MYYQLFKCITLKWDVVECCWIYVKHSADWGMGIGLVVGWAKAIEYLSLRWILYTPDEDHSQLAIPQAQRMVTVPPQMEKVE